MFRYIFFLFLITLFGSDTGHEMPGQQPNIAVDAKGVIRVVYGEDNAIYCVTSANMGSSFSAPVKVAELSGMHLGNSRGPQIASSRNYSLITAITKDGTIHSFRLSNASNAWIKSGNVNDEDGSAPEGLMAL